MFQMSCHQCPTTLPLKVQNQFVFVVTQHTQAIAQMIIMWIPVIGRLLARLNLVIKLYRKAEICLGPTRLEVLKLQPWFGDLYDTKV